jgi:hypothetical protein
MAYMDMIYYAPKFISDTDSSKFKALAKRCCTTANANLDDFMYLVNILPPEKEMKKKFLVKLPMFLQKYRDKYPLIKK